MAATNTTISIDFWNTLVRAESGGTKRREARLKALHKVVGRYTDIPSSTILEEAKLRASKEFDVIWFGEQRTPTTRELVDNILGHLEVNATSDERSFLIEAFEDSLWEGPPEFTEQAKEILPILAARYPLALISDTMYSPGRVIRDYLAAEGVLDYFKVLVFSDETGYSKPDPRAYQTVLEATGSSPSDSWHIGDLLKTDITGAQNIGMKTILFVGHTDLYPSEESNLEPDHICRTWDEIRSILY